VHHVNTLFVVTTFAGMLLPVLAPSNNRRTGRRIFWIGFLIASTSAFLIAYPPDWKSGTVWSLLACFLMLMNAYFSTSHIKIHGNIYAFNVFDSVPDPSPGDKLATKVDNPDYDPAPDSYGGLATAKKMWWLMVPVMAMCSVDLFTHVLGLDKDRPWLTALTPVVIVVIATVFGYGDASWGYPIARGQRAQFGIITVITAGVFTILYATAYYAGKRRPLRRQQSMEYRAHPRHQKRYPS